ncbi:MAG: type IX secretion system protein PorQ [Bacteroidaceae bacterium]|nr:type IX secretion system protein PorQ [Bacteroidaceae bacterium]
MKRVTASLVLALAAVPALHAQSLQTSFEFLQLPTSAHESSLGGHCVSLHDADPALFIDNPANLTAVTTRLVGLDAMTWFAGTTVAGAQYCSSIDERSFYAFNARYVNYGRMARTEADGTETGTFSSKDMAVGATFSYRLSDSWSGGLTGNFICSRYSSMTSVAIGVNMGLLYENTDNGISLGLAATGLGGQVKAFENTFQKLPFDLCAGLTWKPEHAPLRFTLTMDRLTDWDRDDFYFAEDEKAGFGQILKRHFYIGTDILLTDRFYVAGGCSLRNREELAGKGSRGMTGFHLGTGLKVGRVMFDLSYGKFQVSESSLLLNFAFAL